MGVGQQDWAWGRLPSPCPVVSCSSRFGSNAGGPAASPQLCSTCWVLVGECPAERGWLSPAGAVPAQELAQKLEKQERITLKLQKQLRAYVKQIQEFTGKCPHRSEAWG